MKPSHSPATQRILELFAGPLKDVRFPDLDAETLAASVLALDEALLAVASAEATLDAARRALADKRDALERTSEKALAYARVYALERPELRAVVEVTPARRGPGRPRKRAEKDGVEPEIAAE